MEEKKNLINSKPLQMISWSEKIKDDKQFFKSTADYYISLGLGGYAGLDGSIRGELKTLYDVYNNQIPEQWFKHVTDPLSANNPLHAKFPAKIRPTNILRTNIDMLLSEWMHRPFKYHTESIGEDGYNRYMDQLNKQVNQNVMDLFVSYASQEMLAQGASEEDVQKIDPSQIPIPTEVKEKFQASYKDKIAIQNQKWLERTIKEYFIKRLLHRMFKDWLIAGESASYKGIHNGELVYMRLSPLYLNYDKAPNIEFIEDGEWATYTHFMSASSIVEMFYKDLTTDELKKIEAMGGQGSPSGFYSYLEGLYSGENLNKIPVYQTTWKGKEKVLFIKYIDPTTGQPVEDYADEAERPLLKAQFGDNIEITEEWHNRTYETWRIGNDTYVRMQAVESQRSSMNNLAKTKLNINGKKYSDTHSKNISIVNIGLPYLIMYMILGRTLELTVAKSKGKILLMDNNAIPRSKGWNEERFFYYSEALGYGLLDRNQLGVDKSWNQYTVVDMSLFDQIEQLITLQAHYKQEWDDALGINRQRKGQTYGDESGVAAQQAQFQSSIITDMIFIGFDEFVEKELQGLIDLSKYTNIDGLRRLYNSDNTRDTILEIDPNEYSNADIGVFIVDGLEDSQVMNTMKANVNGMIQNGVKLSTVLDVLHTGNVAGLSAKLKQIEAMEEEAASANQQAEFKAQEDADDRKMKFMEYEKMLEESLINVEYDRKEDIENIKGEFNILSYGNSEDANNNGIPDASEIVKRDTEREKILAKEREQARELNMTERLSRLKEFLSSQNKAADRESKERIADKTIKAKLQGDRIKARTKTKTAK